MKRIFWIAIIALMIALLPAAAMAENSLNAAWENGKITVRWTDSCKGYSVLTLYEKGWPVLVTNVNCAAGEYTVPDCYVREGGRYSVRLRTAESCLKVPVTGSPSGTETPGATEIPSATATPVVTAAPEATATPVITSEPAITPIVTAEPTATPIVTPKPTAMPVITVRPTATPVVTVRPTATPVVTVKPTATPSGSNSSGLAAQVVAEVNAERAKYGLGALTVDADLTAAACVRAQEIVQQFSHTRPDGSSWSTVSGKARGENIAKGYRSVDAVMAAWMSSEGHRANILRESFGSIGVCAYEVNGVLHWVQLFGA